MYETREQTTERTEVQLRYSLVSAVPDKTTIRSSYLDFMLTQSGSTHFVKLRMPNKHAK